MHVLPWHIAYASVVLSGNVALALAHAGWSLGAQLTLTLVLPALGVAILVLGRGGTRR